MDYEQLYPIVEQIAAQKCAFFVGAGVSMGAGLPGWDELMKSLSGRLQPGNPEHDFLAVAQAYEHLFGRQHLLSSVCDRLAPIAEPTDNHAALGRLALLGVGLWVTTNWDSLLETAFRAAGLVPRVVVRNEDVPTSGPGSPVLIKIHGDLASPDTIVITKNDFWKAPLDRSVVWNKLGSAWAECCFVFVGYSFRDPDFDQLQAQLLHHLGRNCLPHSYAVVFNSDQVDRADLESRNIHVIDLGTKPDAAALHHFLTSVTRLATQFAVPRSEYHDAQQAGSLVPLDVQQRLESDGYCLMGCVEYLVYCDYVDDRTSVVPPGWRPRPTSGSQQELSIQLPYRRWSVTKSSCWEGIAVGRLRNPNDAQRAAAGDAAKGRD